MTDTLRSLLGDLADDVPHHDLVEGRWDDARRRRRRSGAVVGGALAATAAVVAGVALSGGAPTAAPSPAPAPAPPTEVVVPDGPDGFVAGHPAYLSPTVADEAILPEVDGGEVRIDLSAVAGDASELERATYAFAAPGSGVPLLVWLVDASGTAYRLEVPVEYGMAVDENGTLPFLRTSLSPSGRELMLVTRDGYALYDVDDAAWREPPSPSGYDPEALRTAAWSPEDPSTDHALPVADGLWFAGEPPVADLAGFPLADRWGPVRLNADGGFAGGAFSTEIREIDAGTLNPEVVAAGGLFQALLVIQDPERARFKGCCAVTGWLDRDRVVYESRTADRMRLIAWDIRDGAFARLVEVIGLPEGGVVGSYADLGSTATSYDEVSAAQVAERVAAWVDGPGQDLGPLVLNSVTVPSSGTAVVDLDLTNASVSTSAQSQALWDGLIDAVFSNDDAIGSPVLELEPRFNGSCEAFGAAVEAGECLVVQRDGRDGFRSVPR